MTDRLRAQLEQLEQQRDDARAESARLRALLKKRSEGAFTNTNPVVGRSLGHEAYAMRPLDGEAGYIVVAMPTPESRAQRRLFVQQAVKVLPDVVEQLRVEAEALGREVC